MTQCYNRANHKLYYSLITTSTLNHTGLILSKSSYFNFGFVVGLQQISKNVYTNTIFLKKGIYCSDKHKPYMYVTTLFLNKPIYNSIITVARR
jgi:hypothetical protein